MLYNIFYYTFFSGLICLGGGGVLYICDKELFDEITISISWESVKLYHIVENEINNALKQPKLCDKISNKKISKTDLFIGYNKNDESVFKTRDYADLYIKDNNFDLMIIKNEKNDKNATYCKVILDKENINSYEIEDAGKIFLQVEIEQYDSRISIHSYLVPFYLKDNKILDETFLKWYLNEYFKMILSDNYIIHIIDSNINMFTIDKTQAILITEKNDNNNKKQFIYKIINNNI